MAQETSKRETKAVAQFFDSVNTVKATDPKEMKGEKLAGVVLHDNDIKVPGVLGRLLGGVPEKAHGSVLDAVVNGAALFQKEHGFKAPAEFLEVAIHQAFPAGVREADSKILLDSATNAHIDNLSLQPDRVIVSIISTLAEAIPFAAPLPVDIRSNEARLAIITHHAKSNFGDYSVDDSLDGINAGGQYLDSERMLSLSTNGGGASGSPLSGVFTAKGAGAVSAGNPAVPLLAARQVVYINGFPAVREAEDGSGVIAGKFKIGSTDYTITGTVDAANGAITVQSSPALPANTKVSAAGYIDFEKAPGLAPEVGMKGVVYKLFARASRGLVSTSIDANTQFNNELSVDPQSESLLALRSQQANERHYRALAKMKAIAGNLTDNYDFKASTYLEQKTRAMVMMDLASTLGRVSQVMANNTNDHGIDTLYTTGFLAAMFLALPAELFTPSGVTPRPGIWRMGRFLGLYDVYYMPKGLNDDGMSSELLCLGRSTQGVARNPIVVGDAVPAMFMPLALGTDFVGKQGYYQRSFTDVNPYLPAAQGAALITVTNMRPA